MTHEKEPTVAVRVNVGCNIAGSGMTRDAGEPTNECADMSGTLRDAVHSDQAT